MKVLFLIETLGVGGAEMSLLQILSRLRIARPLMCHIYQGDELKRAYESAGIAVVSLNLPPKYRFLRAVRMVEELILRDRPDLIHTTLFRAEMVGRIVGKRLGIPVICSFVSECYADIRWQSLTPLGRVKLKMVQLLDRFTARWASHFIANSQAVKDSEARSLRIPRDKVTVIHRGRDPDLFAISWSEHQAYCLRRELHIAEDAPVVLNVGRLLDSKGQTELIEAFRRVAARVPGAVLLIAGEGPERERLDHKIQSTGQCRNVRLLGLRDDVPQLLALASVFAFPSYYEGHPGSVVEAMFAGKPVVLSDIPVHRETVTAGDSGLLVPVRNPWLLADAILWALLNPEAATVMGRRAQQSAMLRFHINSTAQAHEQLYQRIFDAHSRSRSGLSIGLRQHGESTGNCAE